MTVIATADAGGSLRSVRIAVTGAGGQLGGYLGPALAAAGAIPIGFGHAAGPAIEHVVDIGNAAAVREALNESAPAIVIHAAAYTDVDGCERNPGRAEAVNAQGSANVATAARAIGAHLIMISTDFVFAGDGGAPYGEEAPPRPLSVYGQSKLAGEAAVLGTDPGFAVARTAWLYGGAGKHFPRTILGVLRDRAAIEVVTDETGSPTFAGDLAEAVVALAAIRAAGIFHLPNEGRASRFAFAQAVAGAAGIALDRIAPTTSVAFLAKYPLPAPRPADSTLGNSRAAALGIALRPWRDAVAAYVPRLAAEFGLAPSGEQPAIDEGVAPR